MPTIPVNDDDIRNPNRRPGDSALSDDDRDWAERERERSALAAEESAARQERMAAFNPPKLGSRPVVPVMGEDLGGAPYERRIAPDEDDPVRDAAPFSPSVWRDEYARPAAPEGGGDFGMGSGGPFVPAGEGKRLSEADVIDIRQRYEERKAAQQSAADRSRLMEGVNPDQSAKALELAGRTGRTRLEIQQDIPGFTAIDMADRLDRLRASAPKLRSWLDQTPDNFDLAHDDTENLEWWDVGSPTWEEFGASLKVGIQDKPREQFFGAIEMGTGIARMFDWIPGVKPLLDAGDAEARKQRLIAAIDAFGSMPEGDTDIEKGIYGAGMSAPSSAISTLVSIVTRSPVSGPAALGAMTAGGAYGEAEDAGKPFMDRLRYAVTQGGIETATELVPMQFLLGDLTKETPFAKMFFRQVVAEGLSEQAATFLQDASTWLELNPEKTIGEFFAERPSAALQTLVASTLISGVQTTIAKGADEGLKAVDAGYQQKRTEDIARMMEAMAQGAAGSKLLKRMPEKYREAVAAITKDGPLETIRVDSEAFGELAQEKGVTVEKLAQAFRIDAAEALTAIEAGHDVVIPAGNYAAMIQTAKKELGFSGETVHQALAPNIRLRADDFTAKEVEAMKKIAAEEKAARETTEGETTFADAADRVREDSRKRLAEAGRFNAETTAIQSAVPAELIVTLAERTGQDPEVLWKEYAAKVENSLKTEEGELAQGGDRAPVEVDDATLQRAAEKLSEYDFAIWKAATLEGRSNSDIADDPNIEELRLKQHVTRGDKDAMPGRESVAVVLSRARAKGFVVPEAQRGRGDAIKDDVKRLVKLGLTSKQIHERLGRPPELRNSTNAQVSKIKKEMRERGEVLAQEQRGGFTGMNLSQEAVIRLYESANLSTFVHETAHWYLTTLEKMARLENPHPFVIEQLAAIRNWAGKHPEFEIYDANGQITEQGVEVQESFAETFEAYLREGKAPSTAMRSVFAAFKSWLLRIYKNIVDIGGRVRLNAEITEVFDRALATDEALAAVRKGMDQNAEQMAKAMLDKGVITQRQYERTKARLLEAKEKAEADLMARLMEQYERNQKTWWREEERETRRDVASEIDEQPAMRAYSWLAGEGWRDTLEDHVERAAQEQMELAQALRAFHGSKHRFDRFEISTRTIGSGEGTQSRGYGLYFADRESLANFYKNIDRVTGPEDFAGVVLAREGGDIARARAFFKGEIKRVQKASWGSGMDKSYKDALAALNAGKATNMAAKQTFLYEVDLNVSPEAEMLDMDASIASQSEAVQERVAAAWSSLMGDAAFDPARTGYELFEIMGNRQPTSDALLAAGIKGVRFLDALSRARQDGSRNYVMFSADDIKIVARNGEAVGEATEPPGLLPAELIGSAQGELAQSRQLDAMGFYSAAQEAATRVPDNIWKMGWQAARNSIAKGQDGIVPRKSELEWLGIDAMFGDTKLRGEELKTAVLEHIAAKRLELVENFARFDPNAANDKLPPKRQMLERMDDGTLAGAIGLVIKPNGFGGGAIETDIGENSDLFLERAGDTSYGTSNYYLVRLKDGGVKERIAEGVMGDVQAVAARIIVNENMDKAVRRLTTEQIGDYWRDAQMDPSLAGLVRGSGDIRLPGEDVPLFEMVIGLPEGVPGSDYWAPRSHVGGKAQGTLVTAHGEERVDDKGQRTVFVGQVQSDMAQQAREDKADAEHHRVVRKLLSENPDVPWFGIDGVGEYRLPDPGEPQRELISRGTLERGIASAQIAMDAPLLATSEWTNVAVRAMVYRAARDGFQSISFPTAETSEIIQGNDDAAQHYETNVKGALEKLAKQLGGAVRKGGVGYDAELRDWATVDPDTAHALLNEVWKKLPAGLRQTLLINLPKVRRDGDTKDFYVSNGKDPRDGVAAGFPRSTFDYELREAKWNPLIASYSIWVQGAVIWEEPGAFEKMLETAGGGGALVAAAFEKAKTIKADAYILDITPEMREKIVLGGFPLFQTKVGKGRTSPPPNISPMRLDLRAVEEQYGPEALAALPPKVRAYSANATDAGQFVELARDVQATLKKKPPRSLWKFLSLKRTIGEGNDKISYSGIRDPDGEILAMIGKRNEARGLIATEKGGAKSRSYSYEEAAHAAWEEGYFNGDSPPSIAEFLDALRADFDGTARLYRSMDQALVQQIDNANEWANWFDQNEIDINEENDAVLKAVIEVSLSRQTGAVLSMSTEDRHARATAQGFDTSRVWYHGTQAGLIEAFDLSRVGRGKGTSQENAIWFAATGAGARPYAKTSPWNDAAIYPVFVRGKIKVVDAGGRTYDWSGWVTELLETARAEGFAGVHIRNMREPIDGGGDQLAVFEPKNIRGVFDSFDPANTNSALLVHAPPQNNFIGPDEAAPFFKMADGRALLEGIKAGPMRDKLIREETRRRMIAKHGDIFNDGTIAQEAAAYAQNEVQQRQYEIELEALSNASGKQAATNLARETARETLRDKQVREVLNYPQWLTLAERWGKKALEAAEKGDFAKAADFKRYQLINTAMFREARKLAETVEKARKHLLAYGDKSKQTRLLSAGKEYQEQMNGLLDDYQFRPESRKAENKRQARGEWIRAQMASIDPYSAYQDATKTDAEKQVEAAEALERSQMLAGLAEGTEAKNFKSITVDELLSVRDEADMIYRLATLKDRLIKEGERRRLSLAAGDIAAEIEANQPNEKPPEPIETDSPGYKAKRSVLKYFAMHRTLQSWARQFAGDKDNGVFWRYVVRPLNEAFARLSSIRKEMGTEVDKLFSVYTKDEQRRMFRDRQTFDFRQSGGPRLTLSKQGRLAFALNWGNAKNRQRLMDSLGLEASHVQQVLNTLDKRDWDFVQASWDYLDTWFPEANRVHESVHGAPMDKEAPLEIATRFGIYRGGYYPVKFDAMLSSKTGQRKMEADAKTFTGQVGARSQPGFTKSRVKGKVTLPLRLSVLDVITSHLDQVAVSIATEEALFDAGRLIKQPAVENAIIGRHGREAYNTIVNTLVTAKFGLEGASGILAHLRNGATVVGLGWKVSTALLQPLGISNSIVRVGGFWIAKGYARMGKDAATIQSSANWIMERSEFMRNRRQSNSPEMQALRGKLKAGVTDIRIPGVALTKAGIDAVKNSAFAMMANTQFYSVDMPTWYGAYFKAQAAGMNEADAVAEADQAVIDSQGGGELHQTSAMQTGAGTRYAAALRLLTNFMSYMITTYNLSVQRIRSARTVGQIAALGFDLTIMLALPVAGKMMLDAWTKGDGEEDEDELWEKYMREQAAFLLSPFVGISQVAGSTRGDDSYGYRGPAGLGIFAEASRAGAAAAEGKFFTEEGEFDAAFWRPANKTAGMIFHYPASQIDASVRGALAYFNGETENPAAFLVGPPPAN